MFLKKSVYNKVGLFNLDFRLAQSYKQNLTLTPEDRKANEVAAQRAWLKTRSNCTHLDCLVNLYIERDKELAPWDYETHD